MFRVMVTEGDVLRGEICFINGMYVHVYEHTWACSELKLDAFFVVEEDLPFSSGSGCG